MTLTEKERALAAQGIVAWYRAHARDLPWRREVTAYRTLVSEIMLQQTRVEAVKPYFERFLADFPDIPALASADDELLMKRWEGLGYYSRARNLKKCAIAVMERHGGILPAKYEDLLALPGIGPYTAGAISSFAYGIPAPAVDGNVLRVISRLVGEEGDIMESATRRRLTEIVAAMIPPDAASDFGQGIIELGALVCAPNKPPVCSLCPLAPLCRAKRDGTTDKIPFRTPKRPRRIEEKTILVVRSGKRTLIRRRAKKGLLAGLWEFPSLAGHASQGEIIESVRSLGLEPLQISPLPDAKHIFTHIEWHMRGYLVRVAEPEHSLFSTPDDELHMPSSEELLASYAIPSAFSAYLAALKQPL